MGPPGLRGKSWIEKAFVGPASPSVLCLCPLLYLSSLFSVSPPFSAPSPPALAFQALFFSATPVYRGALPPGVY